MKKSILISVLLAVLLSACAPQGTPTMSPADVQGTAVAAAWTMVAETEAAIPTATPVPPTSTPTVTPPPSNTPPPPPTSSLPTSAPTVSVGAGTDNCVHPLNIAEAGPTHETLIRNQTGGSINLSLNLYDPNDFGQCGAISVSLAKNASTTLGLPAGNWWGYAWVTLSGGNSSTASGSFFVQPAQFDKIELCVREEIIVYKPQC